MSAGRRGLRSVVGGLRMQVRGCVMWMGRANRRGTVGKGWHKDILRRWKKAKGP